MCRRYRSVPVSVPTSSSTVDIGYHTGRSGGRRSHRRGCSYWVARRVVTGVGLWDVLVHTTDVSRVRPRTGGHGVRVRVCPRGWSGVGYEDRWMDSSFDLPTPGQSQRTKGDVGRRHLSVPGGGRGY